MSHSLDCQTYITSLLTNASSKAVNKNPPDLHIAQTLNRIVASAEPISSGYWNRIQPYWEPFAPKLHLAIKEINDGLTAGADTPSTFGEYISQLAEKLNEPVAA